MRIKISFKELSAFHIRFREDVDEIKVGFSTVDIRYLTDMPWYEGPYEVTPKITDQTLPTAQKAMNYDVHILEIPYSTVSNNSGGLTATIGGIL